MYICAYYCQVRIFVVCSLRVRKRWRLRLGKGGLRVGRRLWLRKGGLRIGRKGRVNAGKRGRFKGQEKGEGLRVKERGGIRGLRGGVE